MKSVLRHIAFLSVLATVLVVATATESASAASATEAKPAATKPAAAKTTAAAKAKDDEQSAAARRAADSEFEREALDTEAFTAGEERAEKQSSGGGSFIRGVFGLIVVIGAIFGVQWLLKKWGQAKMDGVGGGAAGLIDVVATTGLSQGRSLHLVRVADELVLVGSTEHSISRLGEFDARQLVGDSDSSTFALPSATRRALPAAGGSTPANDFHGMLEGSLAGGPVSVAAAVAAQPSPATEGSFLQRFLHNLKMQTAR